MAIGASSFSPSLGNLTPAQSGAGRDAAGVPVGVRGAVSLGSGLRTGVTVVERAIQTSAELSEARERAREALLEQARLEREAASAEADAEAETEAADLRSAQTAERRADEPDSRSIEAAVIAGEAGQEPPRGAFVDLTV